MARRRARSIKIVPELDDIIIEIQQERIEKFGKSSKTDAQRFLAFEYKKKKRKKGLDFEI